MEQFLDLFIENFGEVIISILGVAFLALARGLIKKYGSKLDVETKAKLEALLGDITQQGVAYAEQWAKNRNKDRAVPIDSDSKLHIAMEFVAAQIRKNGLEELAEAEIEERIESMLGFGTLNEVPFIESPIIMEDNDENWSAE